MRGIFRPILCLILLVHLCWVGAILAQEGDSGLFPPIEPFRTGYLSVDDPHEIYYELSGDPEGKPVICLHGGPGAGSYPRMKRYFNPEKYLIVLYDQRGAGKSRPYGELAGNDTGSLVADIEKLREHLEIEQFLLFGGSWGTTLGLAYAEEFPARVTGLILRGVFLGTEKEIESHYLGSAEFFPEEHARLLDLLPDKSRGTHPDYLFELIRGDDRQLAQAVMHALGSFELKFMKLNLPDQTVQNILASMTPQQHYLYVSMDLHYVTNRYFLAPGQLLRDAGKIADIPAVIINGRYDMACPPLSAYRLHRALPQSQLIIVEEAGHSETEEGITRELVKAAAGFE
jgi:proline iminopeptidase